MAADESLEPAAFVSDATFREIVETSPYLYAIVDGNVRFTYANPAAKDVLGYEPQELIGMSATDVIHPDDFDLALGALGEVVDYFDDHPNEGIPMNLRLLCKDGSITFVETGAVPRLKHPDVQGVILRGRPVSGQQLLDQALEALVTSSPLDDVLDYLITSIEHELIGTQAAIGYSWDGQAFGAVVSHGLPPALSGSPTEGAAPPYELDAPWAMAMARQELTIYPDQDSMPAAVRAAAIDAGYSSCWAIPVSVPPNDVQLACILVWRTIPGQAFVSHQVALERARRLTSLAFERRHTEDLLRHAALHDTLTGIANRAQFFQRLEAATTAGLAGTDTSTNDHGPAQLRGQSPRLLAVLYIDLDGFKVVNDTYGHAMGDALLRIVTDRITEAIRPADLVARLGGDEFSVLCAGLADTSEATAIADRLIQAVSQPITVGEASVLVGASIGVAVALPGDTTGRELLDAADTALYDAKRAGKGCWRLNTRTHPTTA